ncbi:MAG: adenylosuccinate lyase [Bdellovibrionota bacterium]|nr:MAG: adenylosuccinate lyase [Bdellovibrionota bacterium]
MIPRYSRQEMTALWSDQAKFRLWLAVETAALEQMVKEGIAPKEAYEAVRAKAAFDTSRVLQIEEEVKHDVIAFLTNVAEYVGPLSRYVHRGMTSNDVLDTAFAAQLKQAGEMLIKELDALIAVVWKRAVEFKVTPCIGRSHGIHAEPITFGLKLASWVAELTRAKARLCAATKEVACGKVSGPVGTYASVSPAVEAHVMQQLGLQPEVVATQVVARDRHAYFFTVLALLASSIERFCVEVRHLQRTEVREVEEPFGSGQKGSSAMPHKRNPILSENLTGLARLVRSYALAAMENVALWHERDISHSSVERVIAPDACILTDFMLVRLRKVVEGMRVHSDRMLENLESTRGVIFSGSLLLALTDRGMKREDAYRVVQTHALAAWEGGAGLFERARSDGEIMAILSEKELQAVFDIKKHLQHVDLIFARVAKECALRLSEEQ